MASSSVFYMCLLFIAIIIQLHLNNADISQDKQNPKNTAQSYEVNEPKHENGIKSSKEKRGHMKSIGESGTISSIEIIFKYPSPTVFLTNYVRKNQPLLMKGAGKQSPAFNLWSDAYLRRQTPDGTDGKVEAELGKKESRTGGLKEINFKEFLDTYNTSDIYLVKGVPNFLKKDIIVPWSLQCDDYKSSFQNAVMWFSSGGTKSVLHHDSYENINCLYRGTKRLVMINTTRYIDLERKIIDIQNGAYSSMDVEKVDLDKYPFMSGIHFHEVIMEPGDCLYIPFRWIHHVSSVGSNLAVNIWWDRFISSKINTNNCADQFDKSQTLDKYNFKMEEDLANDEVYNNYKYTIENLKLILFSFESNMITRKEFLAALLGDNIGLIQLKKIATKIMNTVFNEKQEYLNIENDLDNLTEVSK